MTRRILAGLLASALVIGAAWVDGANHRDDARAQHCADKLGIRWDRADGATERLDAFRLCMS